MFLTASCSKNNDKENKSNNTAVEVEKNNYNAEKTNISFVNPGREDEAYWLMVSSFMTAVAAQLDLNLEIVYAERNHIKQIEMSKKILDRENKPDYLIVVNEKSVAPEIISYAESKSVKTFLILNDLTDEQKITEKIPREKYTTWIGSLIPNNIDAGYKIADRLNYYAGKNIKSELRMAAISGSRATPASQEREDGLQKLLSENPKIKLQQLVYGEWEEAKGYEITKGMLDRYPGLNLIWCANDPMALGAIKAVKEKNLVPGKDILIGGLNWSKDGLNAVKSGELVTTVGGHFMCGGWSLIIINDYNNLIDFQNTDGVELKAEVFGAIDKSNVDMFLTYFSEQDYSKIDFKKLSKLYNNNIKKYDFSLESILKNVN